MKIKNIAIIALIFPAFCQAQDKNNHLPHQLLSDPFFSDSSLALLLRNHWKYLKEDGANPKTVHAAWGQGVVLDYKSGYFADLIGFDLSYYGAVKLGASDYFNTRGILYKAGQENKKSNAQGFSKFSQRYVKLKLGDGTLKSELHGGWESLPNFGVINTSWRLSPITYLGWNGVAELGDTQLRAAYVSRSVDRSSPEQLHFKTNSGKHIAYIATGEIIYNGDSVTLKYGAGESDGYLRRQHLFLSSDVTPHLSVGSQLYLTRALDAYRAMPAQQRDFDRGANHYALEMSWKEDKFRSRWGLSYTRAEKKDAVGLYPRHMSRHSFGNFISLASAGDDYLRDKELMVATMTDYQFTPALLGGVAVNAGNIRYQGLNIWSGEVSLYGRWSPSYPALKDLSVWVMFGPGWSYKNVNRTPLLHHGDYRRSHTLSGEIIIDYRFKLL
ncbi:porin [Mixta theicola]|uniref:Porin n=1 Tax=Mixta theicola TaxID=1458355 RepID=A0A2K1QBQ6_9GAMM|nr:OprD family outer membrane porin [Mixta theicola]PNS12459.1 porin [Mixta theicola]GLR08018.1 porin [Mixta theicola]